MERSQVAKVPNGVETFPKISIAWVGCTNVTDDRQTTDRQTDGRTTTYSEHEHDFTFAKNIVLTFTVRIFSFNVWPQFWTASGHHQLLISLALLDSNGLWTMLISAFSLVVNCTYFLVPCKCVCSLRLPVSSAMVFFSLLLLILLSDDAKLNS